MSLLSYVAVALGFFFGLTVPVAFALITVVSAVSILAPKRHGPVVGPLGLGVRRVAQGFLGAYSGLLILVMLSLVASESFGPASSQPGPGVLTQWSSLGVIAIYLAILVVLASVMMALVALPLLALARLARLLTVTGAVVLSQVIVAALILWAATIDPSHMEPPMAQQWSGVFLHSAVALTAALGFSVGARLPWLRQVAHKSAGKTAGDTRSRR